MITTLSTIFAGLLMPVQQDVLVISTKRDIGPKYSRIDYESACGSTIFSIRWRNGPEEHGRVDYVSIDGRPVHDAAETLQIRAAGRGIDGIGIMRCGMDPERPEFRGVMNLSEAESRAASMRWTLFFRITRQGKGWRLTMDD